MKLLLISNSGRPYLQHCRDEIASFLAPHKRALFVSAAFFGDQTEYHRKVKKALAPVDVNVDHLDLSAEPMELLKNASAVMVGGGNTYLLLKRLKEAGILDPLRERVKDGLPYLGWSAGANIAGPTILTTNDWNIVSLDSFDALNLMRFNINPHYLERDSTAAQFAETRDDRIAEYHQANSNPVLGIEEQTSLLIQDGKVTVRGAGRVRRFLPHTPSVDFKAGEEVLLD